MERQRTKTAGRRRLSALVVYEVALGLVGIALTVCKFALGALLVIFGVVQGGESGGLFCALLLAPFFVKVETENLILNLDGAKEVSEAEAPQLRALVARLAERAGLPKPRVCVVESDDPNAFASGRRNPKHAAVEVTTALLRALNHEELAGILAHELAHIRNRDCITGSVAWVMAYCLFVRFFSAAFPLHWAVSREREYRADANGARICGHPLALAEALEKLGEEDEPGGGWARLSRFLVASHPPMRERISRLREMAAESGDDRAPAAAGKATPGGPHFLGLHFSAKSIKTRATSRFPASDNSCRNYAGFCRKKEVRHKVDDDPSPESILLSKISTTQPGRQGRPYQHHKKTAKESS